jgi:hypothetical protein
MMQTDWRDDLFDDVEMALLRHMRKCVGYGWRSDWPKDDDEHYVVDARYVASGRPSIC